jgi:hypothetical protein
LDILALSFLKSSTDRPFSQEAHKQKVHRMLGKKKVLTCSRFVIVLDLVGTDDGTAHSLSLRFSLFLSTWRVISCARQKKSQPRRNEMRAAAVHLANSDEILDISELQLQEFPLVASEVIGEVQVPHLQMHDIRNGVRVLRKTRHGHRI